MSRNVIQLEGRAGRDGERKGKVGKFTLAVGSWRKDPKAAPDSKYPNLTNWFNVVGFGEFSDGCAAVTKGQSFSVQGSLEINEWTDNNGQKRASVEVHLGGKDARLEVIPPGGGGQRRSREPGGYSGGSGAIPANGGSGPLPRAGADDPGFFEDDDESVPF